VPHIQNGHAENARPHWDADARLLWVGNTLVKQFTRPAPNQELILTAFEEENWPVHLDDPLPPTAEVEPKRRLHDTLKRLNQQQQALLRFLGDGTGSGIRWKYRDPLRPQCAPSETPFEHS
jgi:hypothetical protein